MVQLAFAPAPVRTAFRPRRHAHLPVRTQRAQSALVMRTKRTAAQVVRDAQSVYSADKPPWCQPWTIVGTGAGVIGGSWWLFHGLAAVLALGTTMGVFVWWYVFLVVYPASELDAVERRQ